MDDKHFIAALLSEMIYFPNSVALGHAAVAQRTAMSEPLREQLRQDLFAGRPPSAHQLQAVHQDFWRNELQTVLNREIEQQALDPLGRRRLATMLFCSLFTQQSHPQGLDEHVQQAQQRLSHSNKSAWTGEGSFERPGLWRSQDIHALSFTELWDPVSGFDGKQPTVFMVHRGTETHTGTLRDDSSKAAAFGLHEYRHFAKSYLVNYSAVHQGYLEALRAQGITPKALVSTGHSYGGAIAQELYMHHGSALHACAQQVQCVTFGSPRSGSVGLVGALSTGVSALGGYAYHQAQNALLRENALVPEHQERYYMDEQAQSAMERRALVGSVLPHYINSVTLGVLEFMEQLMVRTLNYLDARRTGAHGLNAWGYQHQHEEHSVQRVREDPSLMTHYAHSQDYVARLGEYMGFEMLGKKYMINSNRQSPQFMEAHGVDGYARAMTQFCPPTSGYRRAFEGCERVIDDLIARQWQRHTEAARDSALVPFLQQQLRAGTTSAHEIPGYMRTALDTVFGRFIQGPPQSGSLIKARRFVQSMVAPVSFVKALLPLQANIQQNIDPDAARPEQLSKALTQGARWMSQGLKPYVGALKGAYEPSLLQLAAELIEHKLRLHLGLDGKLQVYWGNQKAPEEFKTLLHNKALDLYVKHHMDTHTLEQTHQHPLAAGFATRAVLAPPASTHLHNALAPPTTEPNAPLTSAGAPVPERTLALTL